MKRVSCIILVLAMVSTLLAGFASAETFDCSYSTLKRIVEDNLGQRSSQQILDSDGTNFYIIYFGSDSDDSMFGFFFLNGSNDSIVNYYLYVTNPATASSSSIINFCDQWNRDNRYLQAYLCDNEENIFAFGFLTITEDCTVAMVNAFVSDMIYDSKQFISALQEAGITP